MSALRIPSSCPELLQAMVGFDTVNSQISGKSDAELELSRYLEGQAKALGLEARRLPVSGAGFNLLLSHEVDPAAAWLLFESHLDTVSVEGMTIDPFAGHIREGRLYGRGACDTKGSGAAMLWALQRYARIGEGGNNVALLFTLDEEIGKTGVRTFAQRQLPALGWSPAGAIVGEPTRLKLVVAHNGVVRWRLRTRGVAAHSSDPAQGRSAISMMMAVIEALEKRYIAELDTFHPLTGKAQCSINMIHGGVQINIIPEHCEIHLDRRLVPGENPAQVQPAVELLLEEMRQRDETLEVVQEQPEMVDWPLDPAGGEGFARFVQGVLRQLELAADCEGVGYGTDASSLGRAQVATVVLGPGDIAQGHTCDEWIELDQLDRAVEIYQRLMSTPLHQ
ncbi:MAG: acetylornithine deacetylase [Gemmatimonadetes bacterium]|nr:acetylornithine deacetylase [Gemmatimonadota bacterium]